MATQVDRLPELLPSTGLTYSTFEVWSSDFERLNNPKVLKNIMSFERSSNGDIYVDYPFPIMGVTAIQVSNRGEIRTAHFWPEENYGIITDQSYLSAHSPNYLAQFTQSITQEYQPSPVAEGLVRPFTNHLYARMLIRNGAHLLNRRTLLADLDHLADEADLAKIEEASAALEVSNLSTGSQLVLAVRGLKTSHASFMARPIPGFESEGIIELDFDGLTCKREQTHGGLTSAIHRRYERFGGRSTLIPFIEEVTAEEIDHSLRYVGNKNVLSKLIPTA